VETKHSEISQWDVMKVWGQQNVEWIHLPATNGSGGIIVTWHKDAFYAISSLVAQRWICVLGVFLYENFGSHSTNIEYEAIKRPHPRPSTYRLGYQPAVYVDQNKCSE